MKPKNLFALPFLAVLGGCVDGDFSFDEGGPHGAHVSGSGKLSGKDFSVTDFNGVEAGGVFVVKCRVGPTSSLRIEGDDNLLDLVEAKVENGVLHLRTMDSINTKHPLTAIITAPKLSSFDLSGAAKGNVTGLRADEFHLSVSGASKFEGEGSIQNLNLEVNGGSSIELSGDSFKEVHAELSGASRAKLSGASCDGIHLEASGGSNADMSGLQARKVAVGASGAANVKLNVTESLLGEASGAACIHYSGSPSVTVEKSGAASVGQI